MATYWESTVMSICEGWDAKYWEMDGYALGNKLLDGKLQ